MNILLDFKCVLILSLFFIFYQEFCPHVEAIAECLDTERCYVPFAAFLLFQRRYSAFRNLGEKTILELEQICQEYNIEIRSMLSIKEYFSKYPFSSKIYPLLFRNNISCINDFKHMTANDLFFSIYHQRTHIIFFIRIHNRCHFSAS